MCKKLGLFAALLICINSISAQSVFSFSNPDPAKTFYGDANGDQQLQSDDLPSHKLQVYLGYPAYNTPQLNNVDDRWNTCDVTGDQKCQTDDMTPLKAAVYLNPLPKNWDSWEIVNVSFPTSANVGEAKAFQISPRAVSGGVPNARSGIIVKLTVAPNSPVQNVTLGGRPCPTPDPKCAVSVGITQWQISTALAPTETGTAEFSFTANEAGVLTLIAEFAAQPSMKIAAASTRFNVNIVPNGVWFVDADAGGANTGTSWADAFTVVQAGMDAASSGEMVWVAEGTYSTGTIDSVLVMKNGVAVYGGFIGTELNLSERGNPADHPTTLDGQNTSYHVVVGANDARFDGFAIAHGKANEDENNPNHTGDGAGFISIDKINLVIINCVFNQNSGYFAGGGIYINNQYSARDTITISNCTFDTNEATGGGGLYVDYSSPWVTNCTFIKNNSVYGGGIANYFSSPFVINCLFQENTGSYGSGIRNQNSSSPIINNCTFYKNTAESRGAGIENVTSSSAPQIKNCIFRENSITGTSDINGGAAISNDSSSSSIKNCAFIGNSSRIGGAMRIDWSSPTITNCTFSGNTSSYRGGAMHIANSSSPQIKNCILWGDTAISSGNEIYKSTSTPTVTYSDIQGGYTGTGNINLNPLFVGYPNLHLQTGSPCKNSGTSNGAPPTDLDGNLRPSGAGYDMGAYEYQQSNMCDIVINCPANISENDLLICEIYYPASYCAGTPTVDPSNTCQSAGIFNYGSAHIYTAAMDETSGPGSCVAAVALIADGVSDSSTVAIAEVNRSPNWNPEPAYITVEINNTYDQINGAALDDDLPNLSAGDPGFVSCSMANNTCSFPITITGNGQGSADCNVNFTAGPMGEICFVDVVVSDGWTPVSRISKSIRITVNPPDPEISIDCSNPGPNPGYELSIIQCMVWAFHDTPKVDTTNDTCHGSIWGDGPWLYRFTADETRGPGSCIAAVELTQNTSIKDSDAITINEENQAPYWITHSNKIDTMPHEAISMTIAAAMDGDLPDILNTDPGYLQCSYQNNTCPFSVSVTGAGEGEVDCTIGFTAGDVGERCSVDVVVADGYSSSISFNLIIDTPAVIYVDSDASGSNNGTSWADAFTKIQDATDAATTENMIWVAEGAYTNTSIDATKEVLLMKQGVDFYGGFAGTETSLSERGNPAEHPAILDGEDLSGHVVIGSSDAKLDGFTITGGNAENDYPYASGGGIRNINVTNLEISNCIILNNNASTGYGGAILNNNSFPVISNSIFRDNYGEYGGAIMNRWNSSPQIINCDFNHNGAKSNGGAIYNSYDDSLAVIENCRFTNNYAGKVNCYPSGQGGAIYDESEVGLTLTNCLFWRNYAAVAGGAIYLGNEGNLNITNCTISGNYSYSVGAGIYSSGNIQMDNSIVWGNSYIYYHEFYEGESTPEVVYYDPNLFIDEYNIPYSDIRYSDIGGGFSGDGNIDQDPLFADADDGNFHILATSPCRDAGWYPVGTNNDMGYFGGPFYPAGESDTDYDGMENAWETANLLNPADPTDGPQNPDGDEYANVVEFSKGTNPFFSDIWYVDADAAGAGTGRSWGDAFTSVQSAIDAMTTGGMILAAEGTYTNTSGVATNEVAAMKNGVALYGGFYGTEERLINRGDPAAHPAILDGGGSSAHVVAAASDCILDGFTIIGGAGTNGGGLFQKQNEIDLSVTNCKFENNSASVSGGAIDLNGYFVGISNCLIRDNYTGQLGGGIYLASKLNDISNCLFEGNLAAVSGGGIYMQRTEPIVRNCLFYGNKSANGGALYSLSSYPHFYNSTISGNAASVAGGALYNETYEECVAPMLRNSILWGNYAPLGPTIYDASTEWGMQAGYDYSDIENENRNLIGMWGIIDADPLFVNVPIYSDITIAAGSINSIESATAEQYIAGDIIEIENDGVPRTVITASGTTVTFSPALASPSTANMLVENWGPGAVDLVEDFHLGVGSPCIDTGNPEPIYNDPNASRNDMGVFGGPGSQ